MEATKHTKLILPNDIRFLQVALAYVREMAHLAGISQMDSKNLELAMEEACTNTIEFAFEPGEHGTFILKGVLKPSALILSIHDHGLPFDQSLAPTYKPPQNSDTKEVGTDGMGLYLIHHAADHVDWINHGRYGKELRLIKNLRHADVTEHLTDAELMPFRDDCPPAPPQNYTIRHLNPNEAIWVAQCIYQAYGYSYPDDYLYYPERIAHMNENGEMISAVAVDEKGRLVGHCALMTHGFGHVAELDHAVVRPANRKAGLLEHLTLFLEQESFKRALAGIFVQAVTHHTFSQRVIHNLGYRESALFLGLLPSTLHFKRIDAESKHQRESCAVFYKSVLPPSKARVHAPEHHKEMLQKIYDRLGITVEFLPPAEVSDKDPGNVRVSFHSSLGFGEIKVLRPGKDSSIEIRRALNDLYEITGARTVYLDLTLAQHATPGLCEAAEKEGFFFSGLGPNFAADGDVLHLQHLRAELDTSLVQMASEFGKKLLSYIASERARLADRWPGGP
jgi:anti-sigma regulatory factor (Ser/Thr protein kinase)